MKFTIKEIRFKDYKSFKGDYISLKPEKFTLLIGRNNCGKSSIIDIFESITSPAFLISINAIYTLILTEHRRFMTILIQTKMILWAIIL